MIATIDPYVPAIIRNVPARTTNTLQATMSLQRSVRSRLSLDQLSYSHIRPMGWNDRNVPNSAPTSDTRPPNTGIPLAIRYATIDTPKVELSHVAQWMREFEVRCSVPRRIRTNIYLLGTWLVD